MILEALSYLFSPLLNPVPKWSKEMGYLYESIGIEARFERCKDSWAPHLEQSKKAILEAVTNCQMKRTALIVGSGPGYDLPLEELLKDFSRVLLVDAVHPRVIRKRAKALEKKIGKNRIIFMHGDVTEMAEHILASPDNLPPVHQPTLYHGFPDIDLVVSLNIASQLPISPCAWLRQKGMKDEEALTRLGQDLIQGHLNWLTGFSCTKLLICDRQWTRKEMLQGRVVERSDPFEGLQMPRPDKIWNWTICPVEEMPSKADRHAGICRENIVGSHLL